MANILVAYASKHGSTAGIAERIAEGLRSAGLTAEARPAAEVDNASAYDAFVVGGAAYIGHWLKDVDRFVGHNRDELGAHPLWFFSSGPLGTDLVDKEGNDVLVEAEPKEFDEYESLHPRGTRVFLGAWDPDAPPIGFAERMMSLAPAARAALPAGDFRDWAAIDEWAREIAAELGADVAEADPGAADSPEGTP